jgi:long-chain acyl-CoA synthetase
VDTDVLDGATLLDDLLTSEPLPVANVAADHLAALMFTAGTAGAPRAAMLTHGNLLANLEQARSTTRRVGPEDVVFGAVPLYHIFGLNVVLGFSLFVGATVLLVQRFDPPSAVESIRSRGVTVIPGAPAMWVAFAELEDAPADAFAGVRIALSGAAKLPVTVAEQIRDRFGVTIAEGYGLTEASPVVTSSAGLVPRFGSAGKVLAGVELRLVDDEGHDALVGDVGQVWVRGDNVFAGYLDDPEATTRVLTPDGWLRTGDLGMCDDEGWLYLVDRAKDLIIVSGFNVYPAEVEEALVQHPAVVEAGVTGVADPATGEAIVAFVVRQPGAQVDADELIACARDRLARYKCPSRVVFVDHLPRNPIGKLLRRELVV